MKKNCFLDQLYLLLFQFKLVVFYANSRYISVFVSENKINLMCCLKCGFEY